MGINSSRGGVRVISKTEMRCYGAARWCPSEGTLWAVRRLEQHLNHHGADFEIWVH